MRKRRTWLPFTTRGATNDGVSVVASSSVTGAGAGGASTHSTLTGAFPSTLPESVTSAPASTVWLGPASSCRPASPESAKSMVEVARSLTRPKLFSTSQATTTRPGATAVTVA